MNEDRVDGGDPDADLQEQVGDLDAPEPDQAQESLAYELTEVVDDVRQIAVDLGVRPFRVFLVHLQWSGGVRGKGELQVISRREILPAPRVRDMDSIRRLVRSTGNSEEGDIVIDRISARYAEDDLLGKTPDLQDPEQPKTSRRAIEFFWEVEENRPSKPKSVIRRFSPPVTNSISRSSMQWRVVLVRQVGDRGRDGNTDRQAF